MPKPPSPTPFRFFGSSRIASLRAAVTVAVSVGISVAIGLLGEAPTAAAASCTATVNSIACENALPGTDPLYWDVSGAGDLTIQGFATEASVNVGQTVHFKIKTDARNYHMDMYRLGYYGGAGARRIDSVLPSAILPQVQPACLSDASTGLIDCGNWSEAASWAVPATAVSGVYIAHLIRDDTGGDSHIMFVVRSDASHSGILYQTSDTTGAAYNSYGGNSLYTGSPAGRAYKVSYNRPNILRGDPNYHRTNFFADEYPMVRWLEANGYDVTYSTGVDTDRNGSLLTQHKVFMSSGHDEYWSGAQRASVEAAGSAGVNLAFFSGNEVFWKTRWESSIDGSGAPYRTLVTYKETLAGAMIDPKDPPTWTGTWRDARFSPPADGGRPENALTGTLYTVNCCWEASIQVPAEDGKMRFWRNTSVANLAPGSTATLTGGTLGYEWDEDVDNGSRPAGSFGLSTTTLAVSQKLIDAGANYGPGTATHRMTIHRLPSGALVFGAGTVRWSWGLDATHDDNTSTPDIRMQQATVNILADMNVQPTTLDTSLLPAAKSTDTAPPTSQITSPASGTNVLSGSTITISGKAADTGGGVVAGVEVSTDGGTTWHPAAGRGNWSYAWTTNGVGAATVLSRAVDDSGNVEIPGPGIVVNVACPCSLWGSASTPNVASTGDTSGLELGVRFQASVNGFVTGVRFYKGTANTGTHVGNLWSATGSMLASATFSGETAKGWQQVNFSQPVATSANTTYVVSYYAPVGGYSFDSGYFAGGARSNSPLSAPGATATSPNGVFRYGSSSGFPTSFNSSTNANYWVDAVFNTAVPNDGKPPTIVATSPIAGASGVAVNATISAHFSKPVQSSTVSMGVMDAAGNPLGGTVGFDTPSTTYNATFTPATQIPFSTGYSVRVSGATDLSGTLMVPFTWSFTTAPAPSCACTVFNAAVNPAVASANDSGSVELGVKIRSDLNGYLTGVRFFKGSGNTGTHVGNLWSGTGALLATATFSSETSSGWQTAMFSKPVAITAGTTYIASYFAPSGHYSYDVGFFTNSGADNPPLHALGAGVDGPDGLYNYAGTSIFPSSSNSSNVNYWVDAIFELPPGSGGPSVASVTPAPGSITAPLTSTPAAIFNRAVSPGSVSMTVTTALGTAVPGTLMYSAMTHTVTFKPSQLAFSTTYNVTVAGAQDISGTPMAAPYSWTFTTVSPNCPCTLFSAGAMPAVAAAGDSGSVELGVRFSSDLSGSITGIRFYKGTGNTGTHIGNLWSSSGTLLASATFAGETATGWQQVTFTSPVPITAGTIYVASYFAPSGHYSYDSGYFSNAGVDNLPLHAPQAGSSGPNGVYLYSSASGFPANPSTANYWIDVVFVIQ